jgi:hypothetical protein
LNSPHSRLEKSSMETQVRSCQATFDGNLARARESRLTGLATDTKNVLLVAPRGSTRLRLCRELRRRGYHVHRTGPDTDLFLRACGKQAIVYSPVPSMLATQAGDESVPPSGTTEMDEVLRVANSRSVPLIVLLLPVAGDYAAELGALRRSGTPYVVLRAPALFHEVAAVALEPNERHLWLPAVGSIEATSVEALAEAVAEALVTEHQGREAVVPSERLDAAQLLQAAAATLVGAKPSVHRVWPALYRTVRPMVRWLRGHEPAALDFADRMLGASPKSAARVRSPRPAAPLRPGAASCV